MNPQTLASLVRARDLCSILADKIQELNLEHQYLFNLPDHYLDELSEICKVLGEPCILSTKYCGEKEIGSWKNIYSPSIHWTTAFGAKCHANFGGGIFDRDAWPFAGVTEQVRNHLLEWYREFDQRIGTRRIITSGDLEGKKEVPDELAKVELLQKLEQKTDAIHQAVTQAELSKPHPTSDPFEAFHDEWKGKGATDKEVASEWIRTRPPKERNKLLQEGEEGMTALVRKCTNLRQARKRAAKR